MKRQRYTLTDEEREAFAALSRRRIHADAAPVWRFWQAVAAARGLDHKTIINKPDGSFTALPLGHGKHWCWPSPLNLSPPPVFNDAVLA